MKLTALATFAATFLGIASAMPGGGPPGQSLLFPAPEGMTIESASTKCGDQAQLSCCNDATYAGDTVTGGGIASDLIGTGSGSKGAALFSQCSKLDLQVALLIGINVQDLLNKHCQQNVACCQDSGSDTGDSGVAAGLPCIGLGALL